MNKIPINDILQAVKQVDGYGSVEIYIQNHAITQITIRNIIKPSSHVLGNGFKRKQTLDKPVSLY